MYNVKTTQTISRLYKSGLTLAAIGKRLNVSRQWIHKVIKAAGLSAADSPRRVLRDTRRRRDKDIKYIKRFGHDRNTHRTICKANPSAMPAYTTQRRTARHRGIPFTLSFATWWSIWQDSGKWSKRGIGQGKYVMSRYEDAGCYEIGNVFIQLAVLNNRYRRGIIPHLPMNVTIHGNRYTAKYEAYGITYKLGTFATVEQAEAALDFSKALVLTNDYA